MLTSSKSMITESTIPEGESYLASCVQGRRIRDRLLNVYKLRSMAKK